MLRVNEIAGFQCPAYPPRAFTAHRQDHAGSGLSGVFSASGAVSGVWRGSVTDLPMRLPKGYGSVSYAAARMRTHVRRHRYRSFVVAAPRQWTPEEIADVIRRHLQDESDHKIAAALGRAQSTVSRLRKAPDIAAMI